MKISSYLHRYFVNWQSMQIFIRTLLERYLHIQNSQFCKSPKIGQWQRPCPVYVLFARAFRYMRGQTSAYRAWAGCIVCSGDWACEALNVEWAKAQIPTPLFVSCHIHRGIRCGQCQLQCNAIIYEEMKFELERFKKQPVCGVLHGNCCVMANDDVRKFTKTVSYRRRIAWRRHWLVGSTELGKWCDFMKTPS